MFPLKLQHRENFSLMCCDGFPLALFGRGRVPAAMGPWKKSDVLLAGDGSAAHPDFLSYCDYGWVLLKVLINRIHSQRVVHFLRVKIALKVSGKTQIKILSALKCCRAVEPISVDSVTLTCRHRMFLFEDVSADHSLQTARRAGGQRQKCDAEPVVK